MTNHKLIPNISKKITKKLKELKLTPQITPEEFIKRTKGNKHRYSSLCQDKKGEFLMFYARVHDNRDAKRKMKKEILFAKELKKAGYKGKLPFKEFLPQYYKAKIEKDFEWFEREHIKENPLGINEKLDEKLDEKTIKNIAVCTFKISRASASLFKTIPLKKFPPKNYILNLGEIQERTKNIDKGLAKRLRKFLIKNYPLFKKENKYLSHGDFNLGNIIETKEKKLKLIDWESAKINNFAFDIGYLFMHLWQASKSQREFLIQSYLSLLPSKKRTIFKVLFQGIVIYLATGGINIEPREIKYSNLKKRREFFEKVLKNALDFEILIKRGNNNYLRHL